jgi:phage repressor protein C with HTH and peptisase S24 domain
MEAIGPKIRKQRRRLGLTLDELSGRASISKPYLSLIETGRVANPPSDEKLQRLEQTLGFATGELLTQAHLHRTPSDLRAVLEKMLARSLNSGHEPLDLGAAYLAGDLHRLADAPIGIVERPTIASVPVINRAAAGYPTDFTDLSYPQRTSHTYVSCPEIADEKAFAICVHGDTMAPHYHERDIVIIAPSLPARLGDDCFIHFTSGRTTFVQAFLQTHPKDRNQIIRLQPRNRKYRPLLINRDQIAGLYRAVYIYHRVNREQPIEPVKFDP